MGWSVSAIRVACQDPTTARAPGREALLGLYADDLLCRAQPCFSTQGGSDDTSLADDTRMSRDDSESPLLPSIGVARCFGGVVDVQFGPRSDVVEDDEFAPSKRWMIQQYARVQREEVVGYLADVGLLTAGCGSALGIASTRYNVVLA